MRRLKLYKAAVDLLRNSTLQPAVPPIVGPTQKEALLYRFYNRTKDSVEFCAQVKQNMRSGHKDFMLVFDKRCRTKKEKIKSLPCRSLVTTCVYAQLYVMWVYCKEFSRENRPNIHLVHRGCDNVTRSPSGE